MAVFKIWNCEKFFLLRSVRLGGMMGSMQVPGQTDRQEESALQLVGMGGLKKDLKSSKVERYCPICTSIL